MRIVIEADEQYKNMFLEIAKSIKARISFGEDKEDDFFYDLPEHVIRGVEESLEEIKRGEVHSFEEIKKDLLSRNHKSK